MAKEIPVIVTSKALAVTIEGKAYVITKDALNYEALKQELFREDGEIDIERIKEIVTPKSFVRKFYSDQGFEIEFDENEEIIIKMNGNVIGGEIKKRVKKIVEEKKDFKVYENFIKKAIHNRDPKAIDHLFVFMEKNKMPLHKDGDVLAYKCVRNTYFDWHSNTIEYKIGEYIDIDRNDCDVNEKNYCSHGLHVGGAKYVGKFYGDKIEKRYLIAKINPKDFVCVPEDEDFGKARVCKLFVYDEIKQNEVGHILSIDVLETELGEKLVEEWNRKNSNEEKIHENKVVGIDVEEIVFEHKGKSFTETDLLNKVAMAGGQRGFSAAYGVPRSTLQNWLSKIYKRNKLNGDVEYKDIDIKIEKNNNIEEKNEKKDNIENEKKTENSMKFISKGKEYTVVDIMDGVARLGVSAWAKEHDVPRSTVRGWISKLKESGDGSVR